MRRMITGKQVEYIDNLEKGVTVELQPDYEIKDFIFPYEQAIFSEEAFDAAKHTYNDTVYFTADDLYPEFVGEESDSGPSVGVEVSIENIPEDITDFDEFMDWIYENGFPEGTVATLDEYFWYKGEVGGNPYSLLNLQTGDPVPFNKQGIIISAKSDWPEVENIDIETTEITLPSLHSLQMPSLNSLEMSSLNTLKIGDMIQGDYTGITLLKRGKPQITKVTATNPRISDLGTLWFDLPTFVEAREQHVLINAHLSTNKGEYLVNQVFEPRYIMQSNNTIKLSWNSCCAFAMDNNNEATGDILELDGAPITWGLRVAGQTVTQYTINSIYVW